MKKFIKWINRFELKRRILLLYLFLMCVIGIPSIVIPSIYKDLSFLCFLVYGLVSLLFLFQYIYVALTDIRDFENKLFKNK
jgi:hypothetical protein